MGGLELALSWISLLSSGAPVPSCEMHGLDQIMAQRPSNPTAVILLPSRHCGESVSGFSLRSFNAT